MIHAWIQEFLSGGGGGGGGGVGGGGGGGGVQVHLAYKKSSDNVFIFFSPVVTFKENYYSPRFQWVWNIFHRGGGGGSNFLQGGPIAFSLYKPI